MRLMITRPRQDAEEVAARLSELDIQSMIEPMLEIRFEPAEPPDLDAVQAVLLTSRNGARALAGATERRDKPVFAVGDSTARELVDAGFAQTKSAKGDVGDLAILVAETLDPADGPLLHVAGSHRAGDLSGMLKADGFDVRRSVLYRSETAGGFSEEARHALKDGPLDGVLFYSPRSAAAFVDLTEAEDLAEGCRRLTAFCLSAAVGDAVNTLPWRQVAVAPRPTQESLLQLVREAAYAGTGQKETGMSSPSDRNDKDDTTEPTGETRAPAVWASADSGDDAPSETDETPPPIKKRRRWPWAVAVLVVVFLAGIVAWPLLMPRIAPLLPAPLAAIAAGGGLSEQLADLDRRLAALEDSPRPGSDQIGAIEQRVVALEARDPAAALSDIESQATAADQALAALSARLDAVEAQAADGDSERLEALEQRVAALSEALADAAVRGGGVDAAKLSELTRRLDTVESRAAAPDLSDRLSRLEQTVADISSGLTGQDTRLAAVESSAAAGVGDARKTGLVLAVGQLQDAAKRSTPFSEQLAAVQALGADDASLQVLDAHAAAGAPTMSDLRARFPAVAAAAVRASRLPENEGWIGRTINRLGSIVTVRRTGEVEGDDTEAIVARAEARLGAGDLTAAVAETEKLIGAPGEAVADWLGAARDRLAVNGALESLQSLVIGRLSGDAVN